MTKKYYLAGPMTGYAQFNFPLFYKVTDLLRGVGMNIVSPAELDAKEGTADEALASADGDAKKLTKTWAELLSRDVALIANESDPVHGIVFLPLWSKSRGARQEAFVGLLEGEKRGFEFWEYYDPPDGSGWTLLPVPRESVMSLISASTLGRKQMVA